jgi:hypothetical protein
MSGSRLSSAGANPTIGPNRASESSLVFLLYIILTAVMTYPAILFLRTKVMGGPEDNFHFLWELWYVAHALFDLHKSPFFDPDVFVPFGYSLIRNQDLSPGTVLLFSPLTHFFGEVFTYNFLILVSFPLTALGTYLLARELWSNRLAAFLAGLIVGFCPYRFAHATGHLSIVSTEWIPFFFLYLERLISKPRLKNAVLAGVFFGLSASATWYYFFMVLIAAAFYVVFRVDWKAARKDLRHLLKPWAIFAGVASVFVLPFLVPAYLATRGAPVDYRGPGESQAFAAAIADYVIPPTTHFWWGQKVAQLWRSGPNGLWQSEWQLYLGTAALLLTAAGVFHRRRRIVVALVAMALGCLVFSFGPGIYFTHPPPLSSSTNDVALSPIPAPGRWLRLLPGFNNLRGWSRLGFFVELSLGLLAAAGLDRLVEWTKQRLHARRTVQIGVAAIAMGLVLVDFFPRRAYLSTVASRAVDQWLAKQRENFAFIEYPIPRHGFGGPAIYSTRLSGKRIIMGNAQNPPNLAYWPDFSAFPAPATLDLLYSWGTKYILVDENLYRAGSSFWNIYQTWDTLERAIRQTPMLKEVAVLKGVHVYQFATDNQQDGELLTNGSFEEGNTNAIPGWKPVGKPTIDRTGKYSSGGRAACAVTPKNFLLSTPVPVKAGQCYRLRIREKAGSTKTGTLLLQLDWQNGSDGEVHAPATVGANARSARRSSKSSMTVRAPEGAKYAVVRAKPVSGKVWVDDFSLKQIPSDCEPVLFVTPNPVSVADGQLGRAAVSWDTCCGEGRVTVTTDNKPEEVLASGESGLAFLDGIKLGPHYEIHLYSAQQPIAIKTASLSATERTATITADPNPAPPTAGLGRTRISWATLAESDAEVFVSRDGGPEQLLARGPNGSVEVGWIAPGSSYEFRVYSKDSSRRVLARTIVTQ